MAQTGLLLAQPVETIIGILEVCDYEELVACMCTCKYLKNIIVSHDSLQYTLSLAAAGLDENSMDFTKTLTSTEKLSRVHEYLQCGARGGQLEQYADVRGGALHDIQPQNGIFFIRPLSSPSFRFTSYPGARRSVAMDPPDDWPVKCKLGGALDYVVDFEHDLLVGYPTVMGLGHAVMPRLVFLSLSTGLPHPLAVGGRGSLPIPVYFRGFGMNTVQVCGRHLSFFCHRLEPRIVDGQPRYDRAHEVMDWRTGQTLSIIPHFGPIEAEPQDGHGILVAEDAFLRAVTRTTLDSNSVEQDLAIQVMPIVPHHDTTSFVSGAGDRPRFGINQQDKLPYPCAYSFQLPKLPQSRIATLLPGPQLDKPSFSMQGFSSDGNSLLAFRIAVDAHHDPAWIMQNADTDVYLFIHVDALLNLARSLPGLPPTMCMDMKWPAWQHCARLVVPPRLPHPALSWEPAMWSSAMRNGLYIHVDEAMENQPPLPAELWGDSDYQKTVYALDFHPRRARYLQQQTEHHAEPLLLGPVGTMQGVPIFADTNVSPGKLACSEFQLKYPRQVTDMRTKLPFGMTEDGALFFGHVQDDGSLKHVHILSAIAPQTNVWSSP
ncbi:unnamed protein product [Peniophora sp. CBMAI 1063]|nr:unnamed protein product [Peniophora sp. CBMAI 1063]